MTSDQVDRISVATHDSTCQHAQNSIENIAAVRRRHSRRGRVVADGPAQTAAAVGRHHRHRPSHRTMARHWRRRKSPLSAARTTRRWRRNWTAWIFRAPTALKIRSRSAACSVPLFARQHWPGWKQEMPAGRLCWATSRICAWTRCGRCWRFIPRTPDAICQPEFDGHARHPVILPRPAFAELKGSRGGTLKDFLKQIPVPTRPMSHERCRAGA